MFKTASTSKSSKRQYDRTKKLVVLALFSAIAYLSVYIVDFRIEFLSFDIKDAFITVGAMIFGPLAGIIMSLAVSFIEMITISTTQWYGFVMNFISSAVFAATAALIYKYRRTKAGSYLALVSTIFATTAAMMVANLIITPFYMGATASDVAAMIPTLLLPFNLIKAIVNAALTFILYKPISTVLKRAGVINRESGHTELPGADTAGSRLASVRYTVLTIIGALVIIAVSILVFILVMNGSVGLFE